jgi:hypothetical protein
MARIFQLLFEVLKIRKKIFLSPVWWYMAVILALRRLKQED